MFNFNAFLNVNSVEVSHRYIFGTHPPKNNISIC